jgi:hypothetical protein
MTSTTAPTTVTTTTTTATTTQAPTTTTIIPCNLINFIGSWAGTYSGSVSGMWDAFVQGDGSVLFHAGANCPPPGGGAGDFSGVGTVDACGAFTGHLVGSGGCAGDSVDFTGTFVPDGTVSGTWTETFFGFSGTWSGNRFL